MAITAETVAPKHRLADFTLTIKAERQIQAKALVKQIFRF
jgi:hypothetical protein